MEAWPGEEKLGELGFFSLEKGCLWGRLRAVPGAYREVIKTELRFRVACGNRMRDTRHMWKQERVKQAIRKSIFLMRTVKQ